MLRTFSKIAALAGLRVGYAIGSAESIDRLNRVRAPYNVNRLGQVAALAALDDPAHWEQHPAGGHRGARVLSPRSWRGGAAPSRRRRPTSFLVKVPGATAVRERLLRAGLAVRDGAALGFSDHLRIAIGTRDTNTRLLRALDRQ